VKIARFAGLDGQLASGIVQNGRIELIQRDIVDDYKLSGAIKTDAGASIKSGRSAEYGTMKNFYFFKSKYKN
jgi:Rv2993c-like, N-terminal